MLYAILCCGLYLFACAAGFAGFADPLVALFQLVQLFIRKFLDVDEIVIRRMMRADEFVQLQVQSLGVSVLSVLDEKDDEKRNDTGAGIDHQLPGIRIMKIGAGNSPDHQNGNGSKKDTWVAYKLRGIAGKPAEPQIDAAGLPDLLVGFNVRLAMIGWHSCKLDENTCPKFVHSDDKRVFFARRPPNFLWCASRRVLISGGYIVIRHSD